ncbi:MAG: nicotinamide-nucleotide amidohydrolase family protein [Pseudomonadota bacterium]
MTDRAARTLAACRARDQRVATAESCTGGLVSAALTSVPGSSDVVTCGFVTYSNGAKVQMLGVGRATLDRHGAVSNEVAAEMAAGAVAASDAHIAVAITGIAGPGGSEAKPEGRVCFALAIRGGDVATLTRDFGALGRHGVRAASAALALRALEDGGFAALA